MGKKSKDKGAAYEREVAHALQKLGHDCRRTAQFCGKPQGEDGNHDASDVIGLDGIHIECKRYASKGFDYKWLEQAQRDCGSKLPAVFHRTDRKPTVVTMTLEDWNRLYLAYRLQQQKK